MYENGDGSVTGIVNGLSEWMRIMRGRHNKVRLMFECSFCGRNEAGNGMKKENTPNYSFFFDH